MLTTALRVEEKQCEELNLKREKENQEQSPSLLIASHFSLQYPPSTNPTLSHWLDSDHTKLEIPALLCSENPPFRQVRSRWDQSSSSTTGWRAENPQHQAQSTSPPEAEPCCEEPVWFAFTARLHRPGASLVAQTA